MMQGIFTKKCVWCGEQGVVQVDETELYNYLRGNPIQDAFKSLTTELREQIISGTHPECWDRYVDIDDHFDRLREERWENMK
jgi:hypothetical protein